MVGNDETGISRRNVLRRAAGLAGTGFALAGAAPAAPASAQDDPYEGFVCGDGPADGETFTVEPRCDDGCEIIRATGLAPDCTGGGEDIYVNLHGTDPTVWVTPRDRRVGSITPGTYRVVDAESCGGDAPACDAEELYRVRFRATEGGQ